MKKGKKGKKMRKYKIEMTVAEEKVLESIKCDKCNCELLDDQSFFEGVELNFTAGYGSAHYDGMDIHLEICDDCFELLMEYEFGIERVRH